MCVSSLEEQIETWNASFNTQECGRVIELCANLTVGEHQAKWLHEAAHLETVVGGASLGKPLEAIWRCQGPRGSIHLGTAALLPEERRCCGVRSTYQGRRPAAYR